MIDRYTHPEMGNIWTLEKRIPYNAEGGDFGLRGNEQAGNRCPMTL